MVSIMISNGQCRLTPTDKADLSRGYEMKSENQVSEDDLVSVGERRLHTFAKRLPVVAGAVGTSKILNKDG